MTISTFGLAVFPFLKTSHPITIGGYTFRSTDDIESLPDKQAAAVREIAEMLFAKDDLRVKSATYAITPYMNLHPSNEHFNRLSLIRNTLAYFYSAPNSAHGDIFLTPQQVSLALLIPERVSVFLVRPEYHTVPIPTSKPLIPDPHHQVPGYAGIYNFENHFWAAKGSRLYGPAPHIGLVIAQDIYTDLTSRIPPNHEFHLLLDLIDKPYTPLKERAMLALHWYNAANTASVGRHQALLNLAIAFESLLRLPQQNKSEQLVDAISLMLGRTERLDQWARQFYLARSSVAHEGFAQDHYFYVPDASKARAHEGRIAPLLSMGRQIFQLCLFTVLVGASLAQRAGLRERFVSNNERYTELCKILDVPNKTAELRLSECAPLIDVLKLYAFGAGGHIPADRVLGAVKRACITLLQVGRPNHEDFAKALERVAATDGQSDMLAALEAVAHLRDTLSQVERAPSASGEAIIYDLVDVSWHHLVDRYIQLKWPVNTGTDPV